VINRKLPRKLRIRLRIRFRIRPLTRLQIRRTLID